MPVSRTELDRDRTLESYYANRKKGLSLEALSLPYA